MEAINLATGVTSSERIFFKSSCLVTINSLSLTRCYQDTERASQRFEVLHLPHPQQDGSQLNTNGTLHNVCCDVLRFVEPRRWNAVKVTQNIGLPWPARCCAVSCSSCVDIEWKEAPMAIKTCMEGTWRNEAKKMCQRSIYKIYKIYKCMKRLQGLKLKWSDWANRRKLRREEKIREEKESEDRRCRCAKR